MYPVYTCACVCVRIDSTAGAQNCSSIPKAEGENLDTRILVSHAASLNGPWSEPAGPLLERGQETEWDYIVTNPTPVILSNGTTLLYYRGTPKYWGSRHATATEPNDLPESVGVAIAPDWQGPYTKVFTKPILSVMNEDPFVWKSDRGFHMLTHGYTSNRTVCALCDFSNAGALLLCATCRRDDWWNTHHSFSQDGLSWSSGSDVAVIQSNLCHFVCLFTAVGPTK